MCCFCVFDLASRLREKIKREKKGAKLDGLKAEMAFLLYVEAMSIRHEEGERARTKQLFAEVWFSPVLERWPPALKLSKGVGIRSRLC